MDLIKEIELKKISIEKKLMLLELDERFKELVSILKDNYTKLEEKFKTIESDFDYKNYYAKLSYFLDSDIQMVLDLYNKHQNDNTQIYDDTNQELNEQLSKKQSEIIKRIEDTKKTYDDKSIVEFIENKYLLIVSKYEKELDDYYGYSDNLLKMHLGVNLENTPLTLYRSTTLIKERFLEELSSVLDDFVKYINSFLANSQKVIEKENYIIEKLNIIKNQELQNEFNRLKDKFNNEIKELHSLDIKVNNLQKDYFEELEKILIKVLDEENKVLNKAILEKYIYYLNNENIYEIKFNVLHDISAYLEENYNPELKKLLYSKYYEIIKRELRYNDGESIIANSFVETFVKDFEKYFFYDLKKYQSNELVRPLMPKFLSNPFSISLLKEFSKLVINDEIDFEIKKSDNVDEENEDFVILDYKVHSADKKYFDENGYAVIKLTGKDEYFIVSKRYKSAFKFDAHYKSLLNNCRIGQIYIADAFCAFYYRASMPDKLGKIQEQKGIIFLNVDFETPLCDMKDFHPPFNKKYRIDKILTPSANSVWVTSAIDHRSYYIHYTGKKILTLHNGKPTRFDRGYALIRDCLNNKYNEVFINTKGKIVWKVPIGYEAYPFNYGFALIINSMNNKNSYIINDKFEKVLTEYEVISSIDGRSIKLKNKNDDKIYYLFEGYVYNCEEYLGVLEEHTIENYCLGYYKNNPDKYFWRLKNIAKINSLKEEFTLSQSESKCDIISSQNEIEFNNNSYNDKDNDFLKTKVKIRKDNLKKLTLIH